MENYGVGLEKARAMQGASQMAYQRPTIRQQLLDKKADLQEHMDRVNAALEALDKNPGSEEVMNAVGQAI